MREVCYIYSFFCYRLNTVYINNMTRNTLQLMHFLYKHTHQTRINQKILTSLLIFVNRFLIVLPLNGHKHSHLWFFDHQQYWKHMFRNRKYIHRLPLSVLSTICTSSISIILLTLSIFFSSRGSVSISQLVPIPNSHHHKTYFSISLGVLFVFAPETFVPF